MSEQLRQLDFYFSKAVSDDREGRVGKWVATSSDIDPDLYDDEMTLELYKSFLDKIEKGTLAPKGYQTEFWKGGMPYPSIAHYSDGNGMSVPGEVEDVWVDGKKLKARGSFYDTPLGRAAFDAVQKSYVGRSSEADGRPVRVSIGFLDFRHQHKSSGTIFERTPEHMVCDECLEQVRNEGMVSGLKFLDGQLIHLALTREPVNPRTIMEIDNSMATKKEDAASIVGEELADEIEKTEVEMENPLKSLVSKSEEDVEEEVSEEAEVSADVETVQETEEVSEQDDIVSRLDRIEALLQPKSQATDTEKHELDVAYAEFKSVYDKVDKSQAGNIQELSEVWDNFADVVKRGFSDAGETTTDLSVDVAELVKSEVAAAVQPLVDAVNVLSSKSVAEPAKDEVVRRGQTHVPNLVVNDPAVARSQGKQEQSRPLSLREQVRRSVGLTK